MELLLANDTEIRMFGTNVIGLGDGSCASYEWNEYMMGILEKRGFDVIGIPSSQLSISGSSPHCITCPILRD